MKVLASLLLLLALQDCPVQNGPVPLRFVPLSPITCDVPYTGQFITGGSGTYNVTVDPSVAPLVWEGQTITDASFLGIGFAKPGGGFEPIISGKTVTTTGYIVGTVPCTVLGSTQQLNLNFAGMTLAIKKGRS